MIHTPDNIFNLNEQQRKAFKFIESGKNIFIMGAAGTGKSKFLDYLKENLSQKQIVRLAFTGMAAANIKGQTIHSFCRFTPGITYLKVKKHLHLIYQHLKILIIDEISMVRADLLDCLDKFLRLSRSNKNPFGGVQVIFLGDVYQLSPVAKLDEQKILLNQYKSLWFFSSKVFLKCNITYLEFKKIYRQKGPKFIELLNKIRDDSYLEQDLTALNQTCFRKDSRNAQQGPWTHFTSINNDADKINKERLASIQGKLWNFSAKSTGKIPKNFNVVPSELKLKIGAHIMFRRNDPPTYTNGTLGKIMAITSSRIPGQDIIHIKLEDGKIIDVRRYTWELYKFILKNGKIISDIIGKLTQYPLQLGYAMSIHKSQGQQFEKVIIDIGRRGAFAHGQMYVALSRCKDMQNLVLQRQIKNKDIIVDSEVKKFLKKINIS